MCLIKQLLHIQSLFLFLHVFCFSLPPADEFKAFYTRLPQNYFLNVSAIQHLWSMDNTFQWRYEQLETSMRLLSRRAHRVIFKLFSLSKRCHRQPQVRLPTERSVRLPDRNMAPCLFSPYTFFVVVFINRALVWFHKRWAGNGAAELFCKMSAAFSPSLFKSSGLVLSTAHTANQAHSSQCQLIQECRWK